jgi:peptide/nickel transport system permease protein
MLTPEASLSHPLCTDILGRDILVRLVLGALVGTAISLMAGYRGGWVDIFIIRAADAAPRFPTVLVGVSVVSILGLGIENIILAVVLTVWARFARMIRGDVLYITFYILFYILRNWTSSPLLG